MKLAAIAMSLAAAGWCGTAFGAESTVAVTNIRITLADLDPDDGVTPSIGSQSLATFIGVQIDGKGTGSGPRADGFLVPLDTTGSAADASASSAVLRGSAMTVDTTASGLGLAFASAGSGGEVTVSAHTSVTVSADFAVSSMGSSTTEQSMVCMDNCAYRRTIESGAFDFSLSRTFANESDSEVTALIDVYASAFAPGVPEPLPALMMLAGVALTGLSRRRGASPRDEGSLQQVV
jgi:hypothetical protein